MQLVDERHGSRAVRGLRGNGDEGHAWIGEIVTRKFVLGHGSRRYTDGCLVKWAPPDGEDQAL